MTTKTIQQPTMSIKADMVTMTVVKLGDADLDSLKQQLSNRIDQSPGFFDYAPVIIDATNIPASLKEFLDIRAIYTLMRSLKLIPVAIRGISEKHKSLCNELGLAHLNIRISAQKDNTPPPEQIKAAPSKTPIMNENTKQPLPKINKWTKIIDKPVRSGMQVYAKNGDLIILSAVNAGAEVIADGNIYVFGPLRGRALAGAQGNTKAHIFCQTLNAQLVAIAGQYLTSETLGQHTPEQGMLHLLLRDKKLIITNT